MSSLVTISLDLSKIDKSRIVEGKNGAKYLDLTISVNDETNDYGKNASVYHSQTKEERDQKSSKSYVGGGKVVWTDGKITQAENKQQAPKPKPQPQMDDDMPF